MDELKLNNLTKEFGENGERIVALRRTFAMTYDRNYIGDYEGAQ